MSKFLSNNYCETNDVKGMKCHNSAQSSLDALTSDSEQRTYCFIITYFYSAASNGKMKANSLLAFKIFTCCICRYAYVEIKPELKKKYFKIWLWYKLQIWGNVSKLLQ